MILTFGNEQELLDKLSDADRELALRDLTRIGTGLGGGDWAHVEEIIAEKLGGVNVFVYDLPVEI